VDDRDREKMTSIVAPEMMRAPGMSFLQHHRTRHLQMKVRFAEWDAILRAPEPEQDLPHARGLWHYARGRALAARGDLAAADSQLTRLRALAEDPQVAALRPEYNTSGAVLGVATETLAGHVAEARGDQAGAIRHLREAARREDALTYGEPPEWSLPVRGELGVTLLHAGRAAEAEQTFREDLRRFPDNGWSLRGLAQALRAQGRGAGAETVFARLDRIWDGPPSPR
jgi:tetratricopeptide (TPR) repeat protein